MKILEHEPISSEPEKPYIFHETASLLVVYKPALMHSAPLVEGEPGTLLAWCVDKFPEVLQVQGRKQIEGGLLHRLDRDTSGLVLFARNQTAYDALSAQQEAGVFMKEYEAICTNEASVRSHPSLNLNPSVTYINGFPPAPSLAEPPFTIKSGFRAFGPSRREVRPVLAENSSFGSKGTKRERAIAWDRGQPYMSEILSIEPPASEGGAGDGAQEVRLRVRLTRGFRHQIRCHLAWIGLPIRGDNLYGSSFIGESDPNSRLALKAVALSFQDPDTVKEVRYDLAYSELA